MFNDLILVSPFFNHGSLFYKVVLEDKGIYNLLAAVHSQDSVQDSAGLILFVRTIGL